MKCEYCGSHLKNGKCPGCGFHGEIENNQEYYTIWALWLGYNVFLFDHNRRSIMFFKTKDDAQSMADFKKQETKEEYYPVKFIAFRAEE